MWSFESDWTSQGGSGLSRMTDGMLGYGYAPPPSPPCSSNQTVVGIVWLGERETERERAGREGLDEVEKKERMEDNG